MAHMGSTSSDRAVAPTALPADLTKAIERAGYYPALVADVVRAALAGEEVTSHLVHQETTFDHDVVRRHITVLALTRARLVIAHADDHADAHRPRGGRDRHDGERPARAVRGVMPPARSRSRGTTGPARWAGRSPSRSAGEPSAASTCSRRLRRPELRGRPRLRGDGVLRRHLAADQRSADAEGGGAAALAFAHQLWPHRAPATMPTRDCSSPGTTPVWPGCCPVSPRAWVSRHSAASMPCPCVPPGAPWSCSSTASGYEPVRRRGGHAPFLRSLLPAVPHHGRLPSTTATSMGTFGTGLPPGAHGLLGYEVLVPGEDRLLNELSGRTGRTLAVADPADGLRGRSGGRRGGDAHRARLLRWLRAQGTCGAAGSAPPTPRGAGRRLAHGRTRRPALLVYLYWGDLDKVGHVHGCQSWEATSSRRSTPSWSAGPLGPVDTAVYITADHGCGMDAPHALRIDIAHDAELAAGIRHVGGEPRSLQLYCEQGAEADVMATWPSGWASGPGSGHAPTRSAGLVRPGERGELAAHRRHPRRRPRQLRDRRLPALASAAARPPRDARLAHP